MFDHRALVRCSVAQVPMVFLLGLIRHHGMGGIEHLVPSAPQAVRAGDVGLHDVIDDQFIGGLFKEDLLAGVVHQVQRHHIPARSFIAMLGFFTVEDRSITHGPTVVHGQVADHVVIGLGEGIAVVVLHLLGTGDE